MQILLDTKKEDLARGQVKSDEVVVTSATSAETVAFPVLKTAYNQKQEFDFNVNFFGEAGQKEHAKGEIAFTAGGTPNLTGVKEAAVDLVEVTEKDTDATIADKVFKAGGIIIAKAGKRETTEDEVKSQKKKRKTTKRKTKK